MPFSRPICTQVGSRNHALGMDPDLLRESGKLRGGGISRHNVKYRKYPACGRYSQLQSVNGSSDAASRCQYCSNLLYSGEDLHLILFDAAELTNGIGAQLRLHGGYAATRCQKASTS